MTQTLQRHDRCNQRFRPDVASGGIGIEVAVFRGQRRRIRRASVFIDNLEGGANRSKFAGPHPAA